MNGVILIDKNSGITSRKVVDAVGRAFETKRVGHTGTLDPMATGVLVVCVGTATKVVELITNYDKEYIAEITLGIETDTLDTTGEILNEVDASTITKNDVINSLTGFVGKIEQEVPLYSAIKINGRRLYSYARGNAPVTPPKREIEVYNLVLVDDLKYSDNKVIFQIKCHVSKGTYIRSLVRDIGVSLGVPATMSSLRRTRQGGFKIENCYTLEDLENGKYELLTVDEVLPHMERIVIDEDLEVKVRNGAFIDKLFKTEICKIITKDGKMIAIYKKDDKDNTKSKPYKMFI